ncbi:MAG TPA: hypothetical protein VF048_11045, partial [Gemmatimonadaceae bacterium]
PHAEQVVALYAGINGHLDDIPVARVRDFERGFHDYMAAQYPQVGTAIAREKTISKQTEADLRRGIEAYKQVFGAAAPAPAGAA